MSIQNTFYLWYLDICIRLCACLRKMEEERRGARDHREPIVGLCMLIPHGLALAFAQLVIAQCFRSL